MRQMPGKVRLLVTGACGRMGREVLNAAASDDAFEMVGATERPDHPEIGKPLSEAVGNPCWANLTLSSSLAPLLENADVIVDFTSPAASMAHFGLARDSGAAIVIGTTGLSQLQLDELHSVASDVRCVLSPNMSRGMNLFFVLAEILGAALNDFDAEITEAHHRGKKDSPSGSALKLAESVARSRGKRLDEIAVFGRRGKELSRPSGELGIHSIRAGEIVGRHTLLLAGSGERIEVTHNVESRRTFAAGALLAARFITKSEPGIYSMSEVLGLNRLVDAAKSLSTH